MTNYSALTACVGDSFEGAECARTASLAVLFALTLLACIIQMTRMFINTKQLISYQMAVLLLAAIECLLGVVHWGFDPATAYNFWMIFLKELQLFVITYFFILSALIAFGQRRLEKTVMWPTFGITILFLTVVVIIGTYESASEDSSSSSPNLDCTIPTFIILSLFGLGMSFVFLVTGILITRRLKKQSISENLRQKKKLELWALIFVYFIVSLTSAFGDSVELIISQVNDSCYIFEQTSWAQAIGVFGERVISLLIPIWAILIVYNIEAKRAKGKSLNVINKRASAVFDEASPLDYDYLVGDAFQSTQSYYSVSNHPSDYDDDVNI